MTMTAFSSIAQDPARRAKLIDDCVATLDNEVNAKKGVRAFAVKKAYQAVSKLENGNLIRNVFDKLLNEFCEAMDPFYEAYQRLPAVDQKSFGDYVQSRREEIAKALLVVTDRERDRVDNLFLVVAYNSLRGTALSLVQASIPALAALFARHIE